MHLSKNTASLSSTYFMNFRRKAELTSRSDRQLKEKIKNWNLEKNAKKIEMEYVLRKQQQRLSNGKIVKFRIRSQPVPQAKIKRFEKEEGSRLETVDSREYSCQLLRYKHSNLCKPYLQLHQMSAIVQLQSELLHLK